MPVSHPFVGEPGIQVQLPENAQPIDFVRLFFTEEFWDLLTTETNRYARQYIDSKGHTLPPRALARSWTPVTVSEMKIFMSLYLTTGIVWKPALDQYWTTDSLTITPSFSAAMKRDRWMSILMFLHFADNEAADVNDKLRKVRPLLDLLLTRFQEVYTPSQTISIDEELIAWKGRLNFRQYIPSKRARFGIKIFCPV